MPLRALRVRRDAHLDGARELPARPRLGVRRALPADERVHVHAQSYGFYDENIGTYLAQQAYPPFGSRLPLFQSLDLRVDKTWKFAGARSASYLDVLNVFNNGNVDGISYNYNFTRTAYVPDLPFLPSLGIRAEF